MGRSAAAEADRTAVGDVLFLTRRQPADKGSDYHERHTLPEDQRQGGTQHQCAKQAGQHRGEVGPNRENRHAALLHTIGPHGIGAAKHTARGNTEQEAVPGRSGCFKTAGKENPGKINASIPKIIGVGF